MDSINTKTDDATKVGIELMSNYLRMVVQPQSDLLEVAMQEYRLSLAGRLIPIAA